jgi:hypothetical protein
MIEARIGRVQMHLVARSDVGNDHASKVARPRWIRVAHHHPALAGGDVVARY